jgi:hypothetical protein
LKRTKIKPLSCNTSYLIEISCFVGYTLVMKSDVFNSYCSQIVGLCIQIINWKDSKMYNLLECSNIIIYTFWNVQTLLKPFWMFQHHYLKPFRMFQHHYLYFLKCSKHHYLKPFWMFQHHYVYLLKCSKHHYLNILECSML